MYPVNHPLNYSQPFCLINMCLVRSVCEKNERLNRDMVLTLSKNHASEGSVLPYSFQSWFPGGQTHLSLKSGLEVSEPSSLLENLSKSTNFLRIVKKKTGFEPEKQIVDLNGPDGPGALDASRLYTVFQGRNLTETFLHPPRTST